MTTHTNPLAALCACVSAAAAVLLRIVLSTAVVLVGSIILLHHSHKDHKERKISS
ncbi:MAG: hypothetical protein UDB11_03000 [Peptococcaceae bacterium]|nr:hypothetical protein [Peptococcaceae bacterium]